MKEDPRRESEEVDTRLCRDAALVLRAAVLIEGVDLQPTEIERKARCPNDRAYAGLCQIEL